VHNVTLRLSSLSQSHIRRTESAAHRETGVVISTYKKRAILTVRKSNGNRGSSTSSCNRRVRGAEVAKVGRTILKVRWRAATNFDRQVLGFPNAFLYSFADAAKEPLLPHLKILSESFIKIRKMRGSLREDRNAFDLVVELYRNLKHTNRKSPVHCSTRNQPLTSTR
jgi:hypothetical protein